MSESAAYPRDSTITKRQMKTHVKFRRLTPKWSADSTTDCKETGILRYKHTLRYVLPHEATFCWREHVSRSSGFSWDVWRFVFREGLSSYLLMSSLFTSLDAWSIFGVEHTNSNQPACLCDGTSRSSWQHLPHSYSHCWKFSALGSFTFKPRFWLN